MRKLFKGNKKGLKVDRSLVRPNRQQNKEKGNPRLRNFQLRYQNLLRIRKEKHTKKLQLEK